MSTTTLEAQLHQALQALCPRVYADAAPQGTATPYVVWHQIGGQATQYTEGAMAPQRNAWVQINVWHTSRLLCNQLSLDIEAALVAHPALQVEVQSAISAAYSEDAQLSGSMQDYSIWADA